MNAAAGRRRPAAARPARPAGTPPSAPRRRPTGGAGLPVPVRQPHEQGPPPLRLHRLRRRRQRRERLGQLGVPERRHRLGTRPALGLTGGRPRPRSTGSRTAVPAPCRRRRRQAAARAEVRLPRRRVTGCVRRAVGGLCDVLTCAEGRPKVPRKRSYGVREHRSLVPRGDVRGTARRWLHGFEVREGTMVLALTTGCDRSGRADRHGVLSYVGDEGLAPTSRRAMLALTHLVDPQLAAHGDALPHPVSPQHVGGVPAALRHHRPPPGERAHPWCAVALLDRGVREARTPVQTVRSQPERRSRTMQHPN